MRFMTYRFGKKAYTMPEQYWKAINDVAEVFTGKDRSISFDAIWRVAISDSRTTGNDLDNIKEYMNDIERLSVEDDNY